MPTKDCTIGIKEIMEILPHRYPFLLIDRVVEVDSEALTIVAIKNVTMNEAFFQGHFPEAPIMPGVLIIEAMAQSAAVLFHQKGANANKIAVLLNANNVKFRRAVHPGDTIYLHAESKLISSRGGKVQCKALVDDKLVAEAEIGFSWVSKEQL